MSDEGYRFFHMTSFFFIARSVGMSHIFAFGKTFNSTFCCREGLEVAATTQRVHVRHVRALRELGLERQLPLRSAMRRSSRHRGARRVEGEVRI